MSINVITISAYVTHHRRLSSWLLKHLSTQDHKNWIHYWFSAVFSHLSSASFVTRIPIPYQEVIDCRVRGIPAIPLSVVGLDGGSTRALSYFFRSHHRLARARAVCRSVRSNLKGTLRGSVNLVNFLPSRIRLLVTWCGGPNLTRKHRRLTLFLPCFIHSIDNDGGSCAWSNNVTALRHHTRRSQRSRLYGSVVSRECRETLV